MSTFQSWDLINEKLKVLFRLAVATAFFSSFSCKSETKDPVGGCCYFPLTSQPLCQIKIPIHESLSLWPHDPPQPIFHQNLARQAPLISSSFRHSKVRDLTHGSK